MFGEPRRELRPALVDMRRYIATVETTKHRVFQFLDASVLPDNMIVAIASSDAWHLGVLSSRIHEAWALRAGGWLGMGNDPRYSKSRCFDPFPFPDCNEAYKRVIRDIAEDIDAHRKRVLAEHAHLTLTGLYNVLEKLRHGAAVDSFDDDYLRIYNNGLVLMLKELHDKLDVAVADAYGWSAEVSTDEILVRLVALNKQRAGEEARGVVHWLRPEYQVSRFGSIKDKAELDLVGMASGQAVAVDAATKLSFPADDVAQTAAVMAALAAASGPQTAQSVATTFKQGRRNLHKVEAVLASLSRMGFVATADGGRSFALRRTA